MAINTVLIASGGQTTYTSTNDTAVTFMSLCNQTGSAVIVDVHVVLNLGSADTSNIMISQLSIAANDTYILYHGNEKILLANLDTIVVTTATNNAVAAITSYIGV